MQRVGEHPVPAGPLAVRWLSWTVDEPRAGAVRGAVVALENAGSATWRSQGDAGIQLSYHWLDPRGNPIFWDGLRTPLERAVAPGERLYVAARVRAPTPPGRYRLAFDLIDEGRFWFEELGNTPLELELPVGPRLAERALGVHVRAGRSELEEETRRALAGLEEPLVPEPEAGAVAHLAAGCLPARDWSRRLLDAHQEGFALVGGSIDPLAGRLTVRRARSALAPWAPGGGRNPSFPHPLLCPSHVGDYTPSWLPDVAGLPAAAPPSELPPKEEPWIYDGAIVLTARLPRDRPRG